MSDKSRWAETDGDAGSGFGGAGAGFGDGLGKTGTGSRVGCKTAGFLSGSDATNTWNQKQTISLHWYKNYSTRHHITICTYHREHTRFIGYNLMTSLKCCTIPETFTGEAPLEFEPRETVGGMSSSATGLLALAFFSRSWIVYY